MQIIKTIIGLLFIASSTLAFAEEVEVTETEKYTYEEKVTESAGDEHVHSEDDNNDPEEGEDNDGTGEVVDSM